MADAVKVLIEFDDASGNHPVDSNMSFDTDTEEKRNNLAQLVEYGIDLVVGSTLSVPAPSEEVPLPPSAVPDAPPVPEIPLPDEGA